MAGFTTEWTVTAGDLSATLPATNHGTYNATVYWGDSNQSTITSYTDPDLTHTYASAGTYEIEITGSFPGWEFDNSGDCLKVTDIVNWGDAVDFDGFQNITRGFYGCANIVSLGIGSIQLDGETDLFRLFSDCTSLTGNISADLFDNCGAVTSLQYVFRACDITSISSGALDVFTSCTTIATCWYQNTNLTTVPANIFRTMTACTNFNNVLRDCIALQLRGDFFYQDGEQGTRFLDQSVNFANAFSRGSFTGTQGTAPDLWRCDYGTGTPSTLECFGFAGNSPTSLDNYKNVPVAWGGTAVSDPAITDVDTDESIAPGQTAVPITGTDFLPYQYDGTVYLSDNATWGLGTIVEQTVTNWSDTGLEITVVQGGLSAGTVYMYVETDRDDYNATGFAVTLESAAGDTVGSVENVAVASISSVEGVAIASIDTIEGIST